ncbi:MAG: hypothetical protein LWW95_08500 [Candidatus Desulfofervidus auxilii]|nr:hypothetical protein [Candidatus Desulfofervidus auxilii]
MSKRLEFSQRDLNKIYNAIKNVLHNIVATEKPHRYCTIKREPEAISLIYLSKNICKLESIISFLEFHKRRYLTLERDPDPQTELLINYFITALKNEGFLPDLNYLVSEGFFYVNEKKFKLNKHSSIFFLGLKPHKKGRIEKFTDIINKIVYNQSNTILIWVGDFFDTVAIRTFIGSFINQIFFPPPFFVNKIAVYFIAILAIRGRKNE